MAVSALVRLSEDTVIRHAYQKRQDEIALFNNRINTYMRELGEKDAAIADKDAAIADKDAAIADKDAAIADKDATIADQAKLIAELLLLREKK